jgi:hypothetical protein
MDYQKSVKKAEHFSIRIPSTLVTPRVYRDNASPNRTGMDGQYGFPGKRKVVGLEASTAPPVSTRSKRYNVALTDETIFAYRFTDSPEHDPYSATKGLWFAHCGWIFFKPKYSRMKLIEREDLESDPGMYVRYV